MAQHLAEKTSTADALRAELAPSGHLQTLLVGQIALGMERLTRAAAREDRDDPSWLKYHAAAERTFYRALAEFRRLVKAEAKGRQAATAPTQAFGQPPEAQTPEPETAPQTASGDVTTRPISGKICALRRPDPGRLTALGSPIERGSRGDVAGNPHVVSTRGGVAEGSGPAPSSQRWEGPNGLAMPPSPVFRRQ